MCYFERTLNIHPPFVVSVAVLIINIHKYKSRAVTLYLIKHRILTRGGFIDIRDGPLANLWGGGVRAKKGKIK